MPTEQYVRSSRFPAAAPVAYRCSIDYRTRDKRRHSDGAKTLGTGSKDHPKPLKIREHRNAKVGANAAGRSRPVFHVLSRAAGPAQADGSVHAAPEDTVF